VDAAFRGIVQAGDHAQQRGFAGAVFSAQDVEAPRRKIERDFSYRGSAAVNLGDVFSVDRRSVGSRQRRTSVSFRRRLCGRRGPRLLLRGVF
jgi:hypothetical protein